MAKYYVQAFYADGRPILGNGDGQTVIKAKKPLLTDAWKRIEKLPLSMLTMHKGDIKYQLVTEYGTVLRTVIRSATAVETEWSKLAPLRQQWHDVKKQGKRLMVQIDGGHMRLPVTGFREHPQYGTAQFQVSGRQWNYLNAALFTFFGE